jgi:NADPH-dependent glutamate synthase beta subunit-like oxidoreductase
MSRMSDRSQYIVAVVGGAVAGSEAVAQLTAAGITTVLFEQNKRPYGKIEDGLPKWHVKLREQEYEKIDGKLAHPLVHFVPNTKLGRDVQLDELRAWGLSAIVLANGAWRDRPLPVEGADQYVDRGFYYQNPFTYWFNHHDEPGYAGPQCEVADDMIVVGGGLASIDIVKMLQLEMTVRALAKRGINEDLVELEHAGIPKALAKHNLTWESLGLKACTLYYRRNAEDMPLADPPDNPTPEQLQKSRTVSAKLLGVAQKKYLFEFCSLRVPAGILVEGGRMAGLKFYETRIEGKKVQVLEDKIHEVRGPITISSIGSIPVPIPGLPMKGETYDVEDEDTGKVRGFEGLYVVGNAVTGKGNINVSYRHARAAAQKVLESYLVGDAEARAEASGVPGAAAVGEAAAKIARAVHAAPRPNEATRREIMARVKKLQDRAGYRGDYKAYMSEARPKRA